MLCVCVCVSVCDAGADCNIDHKMLSVKIVVGRKVALRMSHESGEMWYKYMEGEWIKEEWMKGE